MEVSNLSPTWRAGPRIYIPQELDGQVQSQSHVMTNGQLICMSLSLVHAALEVLHPNEFQSDIRRGILRRNILCYNWEGCMWSIQRNAEFGYQLGICSGTKENNGKPRSSWPVAGPSGCKLTSSQQPGIKYASPITSPYLCLFSFFFFSLKSFTSCFYKNYICI
jgi:hypothetical protein